MAANKLNLVSFESVSKFVFEYKKYFHRSNVSKIIGNFAFFKFMSRRIGGSKSL